MGLREVAGALSRRNGTAANAGLTTEELIPQTLGDKGRSGWTSEERLAHRHPPTAR